MPAEPNSQASCAPPPPPHAYSKSGAMPTESDDDPQQSSAQLQPQQPQQSPPPQQQQQPQAKHALPKFVGHRRRLPPDAPLFEYANIERQLALQDAAVQVPAKEEAALLAGLAMAAAGTAQCGGSEEAQRCSVCRAALPSRHLLDLHLEEVHDSFFAAQVARKLKVFRCLLDTCHRKFATAAERKQHLIDAHAFPKSFNFEAMHLRRHKGQVRPAEQLQRFTPKPEKPCRQGTAGGSPEPDCRADLASQAAADIAEDLSKMSGLGRPAQQEQQFTFGRSRRHAPLRGRGRGRGEGRGRGRGRMSVQLD